MAPPFIWQALDGQGWPFTAAQEELFVADLRRAASKNHRSSTKITRTAATCLINALRCGTTFPELLDTLPGVDPAALLAAHIRLEEGRRRSVQAWETIAANPTIVTLTRHSEAAAVLFPSLVKRAASLAATVDTWEAVAGFITSANEQMRRVRNQCASLEHLLQTCPPGDQRGIAAGRLLHDGSAPGLWAEDHFSPTRVGELSPVRVADLWSAGE